MSTLREWSQRHQSTLLRVTWATIAAALVLDVYLVLILGDASISSRTWSTCEEHPAVVVFGILLFLFATWLVRSSWPTVAAVALLAGHLFMHG